MPEPGGSPTSSEIVFYQGEDGRSRIQVRLDGGTVWLTQRLLAELYQVSVPTINEHIRNIFECCSIRDHRGCYCMAKVVRSDQPAMFESVAQ